MIIALDQAGDAPLGEQLVAQVIAAIRSGRLAPSDRLPTIRSLALDLDVAPGTVARAYAKLERTGWVTGDGRRGTRVADDPVDHVDPMVRAAATTLAHAARMAGLSDSAALWALDVALAGLGPSLPDGG